MIGARRRRGRDGNDCVERDAGRVLMYTRLMFYGTLLWKVRGYPKTVSSRPSFVLHLAYGHENIAFNFLKHVDPNRSTRAEILGDTLPMLRLNCASFEDQRWQLSARCLLFLGSLIHSTFCNQRTMLMRKAYYAYFL